MCLVLKMKVSGKLFRFLCVNIVYTCSKLRQRHIVHLKLLFITFYILILEQGCVMQVCVMVVYAYVCMGSLSNHSSGAVFRVSPHSVMPQSFQNIKVFTFKSFISNKFFNSYPVMIIYFLCIMQLSLLLSPLCE